MGAEVLRAYAEWEKTIIATGAKVVSQQPGELFNLYKVRFEIAQHRKRGLASSSTRRAMDIKQLGPRCRHPR